MKTLIAGSIIVITLVLIAVAFSGGATLVLFHYGMKYSLLPETMTRIDLFWLLFALRIWFVSASSSSKS